MDCGKDYIPSYFEWKFPGGTPFKAIGRGPHQVTFNELIGEYDVELNVTYFDTLDPDRSCTRSLIKTIHIAPQKDVEFKSFYSELESKHISLYWTIIHESENLKFIVEKTTDSVDFQEIATVASVGDHSEFKLYKVEDHNPVSGDVWYRLKQESIDGNITFLETIKVNWIDIAEVLEGYTGEMVLVVVKNQSGEQFYSKVIPKAFSNDALIAIDPSKKLDNGGEYQIVSTSMNALYNRNLIIHHESTD